MRERDTAGARRIRVKTGRVRGNLHRRLGKILRDIYGVNENEYLAEPLGFTCIGDICIVYSMPSNLGVNGLTRLYMGRWVATVVNGALTPSIPLVESIYASRGLRAAIIVTEQGVKAFLYGNDILLESIREKYEPVNQLVTVVDSSDREIIGFAEWDQRRRVYRNIFDLGLYLRLLG